MKTAIVTGATQGIGAAIAMKLATEEFSLAICARNGTELEQSRDILLKAGSPNVWIQVADLSQKESAQNFALQALAQLGSVEILVNNAGVFIPGNICEEPEGQLETMLNINLISAYYITRELASNMKKNGRGHIFNLCSVASLKAYPMGGSYSISKYALLGFSENLREELKTFNIKVTSICPGATHSRSWQGSNVPAERIMPAQDIAAVLWNSYQMSASTNVETIIMRPQLGDL